MEVMNKEIITVYGKFSNNILENYETGEMIQCITYGKVLPLIQDKEGFFNLKPFGLDWIIFQYLLLD